MSSFSSFANTRNQIINYHVSPGAFLIYFHQVSSMRVDFLALEHVFKKFCASSDDVHAGNQIILSISFFPFPDSDISCSFIFCKNLRSRSKYFTQSHPDYLIFCSVNVSFSMYRGWEDRGLNGRKHIVNILLFTFSILFACSQLLKNWFIFFLYH